MVATNGNVRTSGVQFAVQLARVTDRRPRVAAVDSSSSRKDERQQHVRVVVKIRSSLAHYIVNGTIMCVLRSLVPITDVHEFASGNSDRAQLLVAVADGHIWRVVLPTKPLGVLHQVLLQEAGGLSSSVQGSVESLDTPTQTVDLPEDNPCVHGGDRDQQNSCHVELFYRLPGVQSISHSRSGGDGGSFTVFTSVVAPSTLVWWNGSDGSKSNKTVEVELDELEAEQSTCVVVLDGRDQSNQALLQWLIPEETQVHASVVVLQGDVDGAVRFCVTSSAFGQASSPPRTGKLIDIGQPVQFVIPFSTAAVASSHGARLPMDVVEGLLVVGVHGLAHLLATTADGTRRPHTFPLDGLSSIQFPVPIQSMAFVRSLGCFIYCSRGATYACRASDLLQRGRNDSVGGGPRAHVGSLQAEFAVKLPLPSGVVSIAVHEDSQAITCVFAAGRVLSMDPQRFRDTLTQVLPVSSWDLHGSQTSAVKHANAESTSESRIKSLLQRISLVSTASTNLRAQSDRLDSHLRNLHSALQIQKHVEANGIRSLFHCKMDVGLIPSGSFSQRKAVTLACRIDVNKPDSILSLSCWLVYVHVRSRKQLVTTYVFPLEDREKLGGEKLLRLPESTLEHQEDGTLVVSCKLVFQPGRLVDEVQQTHGLINKSSTSKARSGATQSPPFFSFSMPLVEDQVFYLVQLSKVLEGDVPTSHMTIRAAFRQDQDPSLPFPAPFHRHKDEKPSGSLLNGFQLWSALAAHWEDPSYASLRWSDAQRQQGEHSGSMELTPPFRFTMVFPAFAVKELTADHVVAIALKVMRFSSGETTKVRESCRNQSGKFWIGMETFSGNLVVLRFSLAEGTILLDGEMMQPLEIMVQCSDQADLSAMRALLLESVPRSSGHEEMSMPLEEVFAALSLEAADFRETLQETETLAAVVAEKVAMRLRHPASSLCTDEVVRMLSDLARVETKALDLYWKSRQVLNKFVI